jgi:hypothetical protein
MKAALYAVALFAAMPASAQAPRIVKSDMQIDALDPGIKLVRA